MRVHTRHLILTGLIGLGVVVTAQATDSFGPRPTRTADVGAWDAKIVQRAEKILASPGQWNKAETDTCSASAKTFGIACALDKAIEEAAGISDGTAGIAGEVGSSVRSDCRFHPVAGAQEGTCGMLFDEVPIFTIAPATAIKTGVWRKDMTPTQVWAGTMADAESPVLDEAERLVNALAPKKYRDRLVEYNDDPTTTFANVQAFFTELEARVLANGAADLDGATDDVEVEIYTGDTGLIRTYQGWFPVVGFAAQDGMPRFQIDLAREVPPNDLDRQILLRAAALITSDAVWNRADTRKCAPGATTWSIYCAEEEATTEVTGGFHHRRPALEVVREIVEDRSKDKAYSHRLMDYNNDPSTHLADVKSLFAEALARIK